MVLEHKFQNCFVYSDVWLDGKIYDCKTAEEQATKNDYIEIGKETDKNIPVAAGASGGFAQHYIGNGERYYLVSTNNHHTVICNESTGQTINVTVHNKCEGTLSDGSNLYYPD